MELENKTFWAIAQKIVICYGPEAFGYVASMAEKSAIAGDAGMVAAWHSIAERVDHSVIAERIDQFRED
ncbi:hypothetical protein [Sphingobium yanoikuyae]|uniref:hypothetical protein n=1 Tax=Sphingobium yanoikuyae TaxID=13690 RepID=UPI0022DD9CEA|nr:hypothetical protein [Sphingobium yanoikuyae]WBQ19302.1 hypothetical protein PAE53_23190 [Sphingobium yanoikuyae]